jgi:hypothetical protein
MIGIEYKIPVDGSDCITDIDAGKAAGFQDPASFTPGTIQELMHKLE